MKEFILQSFNRDECRLDVPSASPLASVEYRPIRTHTSLAEDIADNMEVLQWKQCYGLNLNDILALPYDVYNDLSSKLLKRLEEGKPTESDRIETLLRELISKTEETSINLLGFLKAMSGKPSRNKGFEKREHAESAVKRPPLPKAD